MMKKLIMAPLIIMVGVANAASGGLVDLRILHETTSANVWPETVRYYQGKNLVDERGTIAVEDLLELPCTRANWAKLCQDVSPLVQQLQERYPALKGDRVALADVQRLGQTPPGIKIKVPEPFAKTAFTDTAPPGGAAAPTTGAGVSVGGGASATLAPAAPPAASQGDPRVAEMQRVIEELKTAKRSEATAAARAASAAQEAVQRVGRKADSAERVANAASGVAGEAKAQARGAAASAAGAMADAAKARTDAASAAGLAALSWSKVQEVEGIVQSLKLTVNEIDWRPYVAMGALAALGCVVWWRLRRRVYNLETVAVPAALSVATTAKSAADQAKSAADQAKSTADAALEGAEEAKGFVRGMPGYTRFPGGKWKFETQMARLGSTHPIEAFEFFVTNSEGEEQPKNFNIKWVGVDRYTVSGIRGVGEEAHFSVAALYRRIRKAGRDGDSVGCEPYVPSAQSPSNGPKTRPDASTPTVAGFRGKPACAPGPVTVPSYLLAQGATGVAAATDQVPTEPADLTTTPAELLPGVSAGGPKPLPTFDMSKLMGQAADAPEAANGGTLPSATGTAGS